DDEYSLYAKRVRDFDWSDFYNNWRGEEFFNHFIKEAKSFAEVTLIDSRTGIAEMSGVCTHHLADAVVMFVGSNQQNLDGTKRIAASLRKDDLVQKARPERPLHVLVIPSRVESAEGEMLDDFATRFSTELADYIDETLFQTSAF